MIVASLRGGHLLRSASVAKLAHYPLTAQDKARGTKDDQGTSDATLLRTVAEALVIAVSPCRIAHMYRSSAQSDLGRRSDRSEDRKFGQVALTADQV